MTTWDVVRALGRLWYVALYLAGATVVVAVLVAGRPGVYWTESRVQFYAPSASASNRLEKSVTGLTSTAGLVQRIVTGEIKQSESAGTVTLPGRGVRRGSSVVLPNSGGQWGVNFQGSVLEVEAVGPTADDVAAQLDEKIDEIKVTLRETQLQAGVAPENMMSASELPGRPTIVYRDIRSTRAVGTVLLLGLSITVTLTCLLDRWAMGRRRRLGLPERRAGHCWLLRRVGPSSRQEPVREPELLRTP